MAYRAAQLNFSKGVVSPEIEARFDISVYNAACREATNWRILRTGGLTKRMGLEFVAEALSSGSRLIPFQFSNTQGYALEFAQAAMRVNALGGQVLEPGLSISNITNAANATVTVAYHGWEVGDQIYFDDVEGMTEINGLVGTVLTVPGTDSVTIDIDTTGFSAFTGSGGGTVNTEPPPPPPPPPTVPPPVQDETGGGSTCVTIDTPVLMADGSQIPAGQIAVGNMVQTRHEDTLEWGFHEVVAHRIAENESLWEAAIDGKLLRGTAGHRVYVDGWKRLDEIGRPTGERGSVVKMTVDGAHTYVANGILSHNVKNIPGRFD